MTMTAQAILSQLVEEHGLAHPARLLGACNRRLRGSLRGAEENKGLDHGMELAFCSLNTAMGTARFAGARLPLYRLTGDRLEIVAGDRHSIGYHDSDPNYPFREHEILLAPGDLLFMSTDGFLDQVGGPQGLSFGNRRFKSLLTEIAQLDAATQQARLEGALKAWQGETTQRDDITVIGFCPGGNHRRPVSAS
jgi:serine phosphatase RsbU (regulator of sigma subunit)